MRQVASSTGLLLAYGLFSQFIAKRQATLHSLRGWEWEPSLWGDRWVERSLEWLRRRLFTVCCSRGAHGSLIWGYLCQALAHLDVSQNIIQFLSEGKEEDVWKSVLAKFCQQNVPIWRDNAVQTNEKNKWKKDDASSIFGESFNSMASMQIKTAYE